MPAQAGIQVFSLGLLAALQKLGVQIVPCRICPLN
jgi:hypothetical protein